MTDERTHTVQRCPHPDCDALVVVEYVGELCRQHRPRDWSPPRPRRAKEGRGVGGDPQQNAVLTPAVRFSLPDARKAAGAS